MKTCLVTCGPASVPIDRVRRITNFSTGELGVTLAEKLVENGYRVICGKGSGATWRDPAGAEIFRFTTNEDLLEILKTISNEEKVDAVFHVAALSDFKLKEVTHGDGNVLAMGKISSEIPELLIKLTSATKVLPHLRQLFRTAQIIGWKYEVDGTPEEALEKGRNQMTTNQTDGCVVNGPGFGTGFTVLTKNGTNHYSDKNQLTDYLARVCELQFC